MAGLAAAPRAPQSVPPVAWWWLLLLLVSGVNPTAAQMQQLQYVKAGGDVFYTGETIYVYHGQAVDLVLGSTDMTGWLSAALQRSCDAAGATTEAVSRPMPFDFDVGARTATAHLLASYTALSTPTPLSLCVISRTANRTAVQATGFNVSIAEVTGVDAGNQTLPLTYGSSSAHTLLGIGLPLKVVLYLQSDTCDRVSSTKTTAQWDTASQQIKFKFKPPFTFFVPYNGSLLVCTLLSSKSTLPADTGLRVLATPGAYQFATVGPGGGVVPFTAGALAAAVHVAPFAGTSPTVFVLRQAVGTVEGDFSPYDVEAGQQFDFWAQGSLPLPQPVALELPGLDVDAVTELWVQVPSADPRALLAASNASALNATWRLANIACTPPATLPLQPAFSRSQLWLTCTAGRFTVLYGPATASASGDVVRRMLLFVVLPVSALAAVTGLSWAVQWLLLRVVPEPPAPGDEEEKLMDVLALQPDAPPSPPTPAEGSPVVPLPVAVGPPPPCPGLPPLGGPTRHHSPVTTFRRPSDVSAGGGSYRRSPLEPPPRLSPALPPQAPAPLPHPHSPRWQPAPVHSPCRPPFTGDGPPRVPRGKADELPRIPSDGPQKPDPLRYPLSLHLIPYLDVGSPTSPVPPGGPTGPASPPPSAAALPPPPELLVRPEISPDSEDGSSRGSEGLQRVKSVRCGVGSPPRKSCLKAASFRASPRRLNPAASFSASPMRAQEGRPLYVCSSAPSLHRWADDLRSTAASASDGVSAPGEYGTQSMARILMAMNSGEEQALPPSDVQVERGENTANWSSFRSTTIVTPPTYVRPFSE